MESMTASASLAKETRIPSGQKKKRNSLLPFLLGIFACEGLILMFVPIRPSPSVPDFPEPKAIRVKLVAVPKPQSPRPAPKPRVIPKMLQHHVVPRPVTPPTLPHPSENKAGLLVAQFGNKVDLGWGQETAAAGASSGYQPPRLLTKVDTNALYTERMKANDEEGDLVIDLWIGPDGHLVRYVIIVPSVYDDINKIAEKVLKTLRFSPARLKGQAVSGKFQLNFRFRLQNSG